MEKYSAENPRRILILGGGFGGINTALNLLKLHIPNTKITLVSDSHHFNYTPALYKLATGASPIETCIPLGAIFDQTRIEVIVDTIIEGNLAEKFVLGASGSRYRYDFLVLALGAETTYYGIPGIAENSFSLKTVDTALALKRHMHSLFAGSKNLTKGELMSQFHFVIVGGGPAGVELSSVIRHYARGLAKYHNIPVHLVTVTILQAGPRLLPTLSEEVSRRATKKLDELGINIILNRPVTGEDAGGVFLKDIRFNAKTIVWTAGVRANHTYEKISGLTLDKGGRIMVNEYMQAQGVNNVFAIGDSASTPYAGTAQTANYDGSYIPKAIQALILNKKPAPYRPKANPYVIPLGNNWGIFTYKNIVLSGKIFYWLRELIDLKFFLSILPLAKAVDVWREGGSISESCPTCEKAQESIKR